MISRILLDVGLAMKHSKSEVFHFTWAWHPPNPSINLILVGGPVLQPKPIWRYLGFFFNWKLNFHHHVYFYATKYLLILNAMKMLDNSSRGISPTQKHLLYRTCILPIALYEFQLWFFKGAPTVKNLTKLKKMQHKAALWITGAFRTSPSKGVEAIAGLILITLHLKKLNRCHHLWYVSVLLFYAINSLLDHQYSKNKKPHKYSLANFTCKQQSKLKSPIKDVNKRLSEIKDEFKSFHPIFHPGLWVINHFSDRITFYSPELSNDEGLFIHSSKLDNIFRKTQTAPTDIAVIGILK